MSNFRETDRNFCLASGARQAAIKISVCFKMSSVRAGDETCQEQTRVIKKTETYNKMHFPLHSYYHRSVEIENSCQILLQCLHSLHCQSPEGEGYHLSPHSSLMSPCPLISSVSASGCVRRRVSGSRLPRSGRSLTETDKWELCHAASGIRLLF